MTIYIILLELLNACASISAVDRGGLTFEQPMVISDISTKIESFTRPLFRLSLHYTSSLVVRK